MKQFLSALALSLIFVFGAFGTLRWGRLEQMAPGTALAAPGETYCVVSPTGAIGPFLACTQVFTTIQKAIDIAGGGETILVAGGFYTGVQARSGITQMVYLSKTLHLYGGYNHDFTAQNPVSHPTTLDAQAKGRVFYLTGTISATIEGFEISGGQATGLGGGERLNNDAGGGLYLNGVTVTLRRNRIHHNRVSDQSPNSDPFFFYNGAGGGLYLMDSVALLENNEIYNNVALDAGTETPNAGLGGGLSLFNSHAVLSNNSIYSNIANNGSGGEGVAGGMYLLSSTVRLTDNLIQNNGACLSKSGSGCFQSIGGGVFIEYGTATFIHNQILTNTAVLSTGAVGLGGGVVIAEGQATLVNNRFAGNRVAALSTTNGDGGGLILYNNDRAALTDNIFWNNSATGYGGGIYIFYTTAYLTNTVFGANQALTSGAGLLIEQGSRVHLRHTTFNDKGLNGGDLHIVDDHNNPGSSPFFNTVLLTNTILANYSTGISVTAGNTLTLNSILWHQTPITINAASTAEVSVNNQFRDDPAFADDGYHLTAGSAAIGRGIPAGVPADVDGHSRRPVPDVGADEYWAQWPLFRFYLPLIEKS